MSILYSYECKECGEPRDILVDCIDDRDKPCEEILCQLCQGELKRNLGGSCFFVPEGSCGNAKNGYSSYHGDSANYKAGRKLY